MDTFPHAVELASLISLTVVLVFLALVFARTGPGIWWVAAFLGVASWSAYAIHRRGARWVL